MKELRNASSLLGIKLALMISDLDCHSDRPHLRRWSDVELRERGRLSGLLSTLR